MSGSTSGSKTPIASAKGDSGLSQARFGPGMLLQHEDLECLAAYPRDLSRLLFRAFFGCGVVCGLKVDPPTRDCGKVQITVGSGVALGCSGDPIWVPKPQTLSFDEQCGTDPLPDTLYVVLCATAKRCAPRAASCGCDEDESSSVLTQERYGFEIRVVREWPPCACGCQVLTAAPPADPAQRVAPPLPGERCACADPTNPCSLGHYEGNCGCNCGEASDCGCDCDCVVLARLDRFETDREHPWHTDHRVRCFIRPLRMRDPKVEAEASARTQALQQSAAEEKRRKDKEERERKERERREKAEKVRAEKERAERERRERERREKEAREKADREKAEREKTLPAAPRPARAVKSTPPPK